MTAEHPDPRALAEAKIAEAIYHARNRQGPGASTTWGGLSKTQRGVYRRQARAAMLAGAVSDALAASQPPAVRGWRPISEHDGGPDLVDLWVVYPDGAGRRLTSCGYGEGQWWFDAGYKPPFPIGNRATHFMSLPAPPAERASEGEGS